jgi:hypothetical protein
LLSAAGRSGWLGATESAWKAAETAAVVEFDLSDEQRRRLVVSEDHPR